VGGPSQDEEVVNTTSTLTFTTVSGSLYEIDQREKRIRWLSGKTRHRTFPADRQWRAFHEITYLEPGMSCVIVWSETKDGERPDCTMTSVVKAVYGQRAA
jgi:hypothetical protein